jgi:hypothetical protein
MQSLSLVLQPGQQMNLMGITRSTCLSDRVYHDHVEDERPGGNLRCSRPYLLFLQTHVAGKPSSAPRVHPT